MEYFVPGSEMSTCRVSLMYVLASIWQGHVAFDGQQFVIETASSLCPFNDFCHTNASVVFVADQYNDPLMEGTPTPCCDPCHCTDDCWELGNCCPDKELPETLPDMIPCLSQAMYKRKPELALSDAHYRVINECPQSFDNGNVREKCKNPHKTELEDVVWVSDKATGKIFQNKYCSFCNSAEHFEVWQTEFRCQAAFRLNFDNWKELIHHNECAVLNIPPYDNKLFQKFECFEHLKEKQASFFPCNWSDQLAMQNPDVERACLLSTWPYRHKISGLPVAANVFCRVCNSASDDTNPTVCYGRSDIRMGGSRGFSILIDYRTLKDVEESSLHKCKTNEIMDSYKGICRELHCPPGQAPFDGRCKAFALAVYGQCVHVALRIHILQYSLNRSIETSFAAESVGRIIIKRLENRTRLIKSVCDLTKMILYSSSKQSIGQNLILWMSMMTTVRCQFNFVMDQVEDMLKNNMEINIATDEMAIIAILQNIDEKPQSKLDDLSILVVQKYENRVSRCKWPYRILRNNTCPRILLGYQEARKLIGAAKKVDFEPLVQIDDGLSKAARIEICLEDYNFVMKTMSASNGHCLCRVLVALPLLFCLW